MEHVVAAFADLLGSTRSREEIAAWASQVRAADDADNVEYSPPAAEAAIWHALEFLMGVDLMAGPQEYLHGHADFEEYWETNRKQLVR